MATLTLGIILLPTVEQKLRLTQRNDGVGTAGHPRLLSSTSAPTSRQRSASPRIGGNNRYL